LIPDTSPFNSVTIRFIHMLESVEVH
jgi:hypothetical protein